MKIVLVLLSCFAIQSAHAYLGSENPLDPGYKLKTFTVCDWLNAAMMNYLVQGDEAQAKKTWELMRTPELNCPIIATPHMNETP